jgi:cytochrome c553
MEGHTEQAFPIAALSRIPRKRCLRAFKPHELPMIRHCALVTLMMLSTAAIAQNERAPAPAPAAPAPAPANAAAAAQAPASMGDPVKGREKTQMCEGCHGIEGWRTAFPEVYRVPRLGGQHQAYLVSALKQYKSGDRSHPSMRAIASSLSDADIVDLAAYYAKGGVQTASK